MTFLHKFAIGIIGAIYSILGLTAPVAPATTSTTTPAAQSSTEVQTTSAATDSTQPAGSAPAASPATKPASQPSESTHTTSPAANPEPAKPVVYTKAPTCDITASAAGQTAEYISTRNYNGNQNGDPVLNLPFGTPVSITIKSTDAASAIGPEGNAITTNGQITLYPTKVTTLTSSYLFTFTNPIGKTWCQIDIKTTNELQTPANKVTFTVTGANGGSVKGSSEIVMNLPQSITSTYSSDKYGFSYDLVQISPEAGKIIHADNQVWGEDQNVPGGPVTAATTGLSAPAGTYKLVVTLYSTHTDPHGFDILRTPIGTGESAPFEE
jgi:hypothetical protein